MRYTTLFITIAVLLLFLSCNKSSIKTNTDLSSNFCNIINYIGVPDDTNDRSLFSFSDQGAWFSYSIPDSSSNIMGFSGPFLMTQENGAWISKCLSKINLIDENGNSIFDWQSAKMQPSSYCSHLKQIIINNQFNIEQKLFFESANTALIKISIKNISQETIQFFLKIESNLINNSIKCSEVENSIELQSDKSSALGYVHIHDESAELEKISDSGFQYKIGIVNLNPNESKDVYISHSFVFPQYRNQFTKNKANAQTTNEYDDLLRLRINEKSIQLDKLFNKTAIQWQNKEYKNLIAKTVLTLQNNWRIPAEGLHHAGCFPSYHYKWFHGFWAWDSWKHAVALVHFNPELAKDQIRAMYDFQETNGFIADCVYRDTTIEANNYRNTKPPLSGWAIWKVFEETHDTAFLVEMYPKLKNYHEWWYKERDFDNDSLCEYGSTDGTLIAAKWESGMDNAIRFDNSEILKKSEQAYSLNQESVDLNAYLYAEKNYMNEIAGILKLKKDQSQLKAEAEKLKTKILQQFWEEESGWFYDTDIKGENYVKVMGPEGWIPLWASIATTEQAEKVKYIMIDSTKFLTKIPFPTVSADHPKFKPDGGYWRGPVWLDQAYFAIVALKNYKYNTEADLATKMLIENAEGVLDKGLAIRENYHPLSGKGLESYNFSWSASHYLLLVLE